MNRGINGVEDRGRHQATIHSRKKYNLKNVGKGFSGDKEKK